MFKAIRNWLRKREIDHRVYLLSKYKDVIRFHSDQWVTRFSGSYFGCGSVAGKILLVPRKSGRITAHIMNLEFCMSSGDPLRKIILEDLGYIDEDYYQKTLGDVTKKSRAYKIGMEAIMDYKKRT